MAYKAIYQDQEDVGYKTFLGVVKNIEDNLIPPITKYICGKVVFVLLDNYLPTIFEKTTVTDLRACDIDLNVDCFIYGSRGYGNIELVTLREPKRGDFRGKIKFTPPKALSYSARYIGVDEDGTRGVGGIDKIPVLQNEKFINSFCDEAFNRDEDDVDYDYMERHAFRILTNDNRFKCSDDWCLTRPGIEEEISQNLQYIICCLFDIQNLWGICYEYARNMFIFPMTREQIQSTFKKRDKENGRRKTIASIVKTYQRRNGVEVDGHLRSAGGFTIDGREYSILIGAEDFNKIFPNTAKSMKRAEIWKTQLKQIGDSKYAYRDIR